MPCWCRSSDPQPVRSTWPRSLAGPRALLGLQPDRWPRWSSPPTRRRCSPTAATGPRAESPVARQRHRAGQRIPTGRVRSTTSTGWPRRKWRKGRAWVGLVDGRRGWGPGRPRRALRHKLGAARRDAQGPTPTILDDRLGTSAPDLPQARRLRACRAARAAAAPPPKAGPRCAAAMASLGATHPTSSPPSTTSPGSSNLRRRRRSDYNPVFLAHLLNRPTDSATLFRRRRAKVERRAWAAALAAPDGVHAGRLRPPPPAAPRHACPRGCRAAGRPAPQSPLGFREQVASGVRRQSRSMNPRHAGQEPQSSDAETGVRARGDGPGTAWPAMCAPFLRVVRPGHRGRHSPVSGRITGGHQSTRSCRPERRKRPGYVGLRASRSSPGWNANGAMPHYRASPESPRRGSRATACC